MKECKIVKYGSTTQCHECGMCWDTSDEYRPKCPGDRMIGLNLGSKIDKLACFLWSCVKLVAVLLVIYFGVSAWRLMEML